MNNIEQNLKKILSSRYGKNVRQAIHDSIYDCYEDGKAGAIDLVAREQIANLVANEGSTEKDSELVDVRVGADGTLYDSAGDAVRSQIEDCYKYLGRIRNNDVNARDDVDFNDLTKPGWYWGYNEVGATHTFLNGPEELIARTQTFTLDVKRYPIDDLYCIQTIYNGEGTIYFRKTINKKWTDWVSEDITKISQIEDCYKYLGRIRNNDVNARDDVDFNDLTKPGWYWGYNEVGATHTFLNGPEELIARTQTFTLDVKRYPIDDLYCIQTIYNGEGTIYFRKTINKKWTDWDVLDSTVRLEGVPPANAGLSPFESIVVIGDSLSVGYTQLKDGTIKRPLYKQSWPQYIADKYNTKVYWGGSSGAGVLDILDNHDPTSPAEGFTKRGWDYIESLGKQALYFIILGVNDSGMDKTPIGSTSDIGTTNRTFYGGLSQIVEKIHALAPNAYVIISSPIKAIPSNFMQALQDVAEYYDNYTAFLDFSPYISQISPMAISGHYSQNGYYTAGAILDYLSGEIIRKNKNFMYINDANNDIEDKEIDPYA